MTHAEMEELYELYALGLLEPELSTEIEQHIETHCTHCLSRLSAALEVTAAMAGMAEEVKPPARLRERVIASVARKKHSQKWLWAFSGLAAATAALLVFSIYTSSESNRVRDELARVRGERNELRAALEVLSRSDTRTVQFGRAENVPHGRVLVNRGGGLVFVGSRLPQLAANRTYQLWVIPNTGNPESSGVFQPNPAGDSVTVSGRAVDPAQYKAVAVSVEPSGGSPQPTTTPILVIPLG